MDYGPFLTWFLGILVHFGNERRSITCLAVPQKGVEQSSFFSQNGIKGATGKAGADIRAGKESEGGVHKNIRKKSGLKLLAYLSYGC
jgi:hypothetical protein